MSYIEIHPYDGWYEHTIEDFVTNILPHFGLDVSYKDVSFTGFWSQGDGASFTGLFYLSDVNPADLRSSCPTEAELHDLAEELAELAEAHPEIQGSVTRLSSLYSHSNTMVIGEWSSNDGYCNEDTEAFEAADAESALIRIYRELADWLYSRLEDEYNFQLADATACRWADAVEERKDLQAKLAQLRDDLAVNPPQSKIQSITLSAATISLVDEIEVLTSKIDQLSDQFHYWHEGQPLTIEKFHEDYH